MDDYTTLISVEELSAHLADPNLAVIDCRFTLGDDLRGKRDYLRAHIPGAVYAHLEYDLCGRVVPGKTGRHPLPDAEQLVDRFSQWGIGPGTQVVAYDDWPGTGLASAARLWWSLRWLGHERVAVLDGGWERWIETSMPQRSGPEERVREDFVPWIKPDINADNRLVEIMRQDPASRVVDSRSADRYRGENETIDPVAGHIPGAVSLPYMENTDEDGRFKSPHTLRSHFLGVLDDVPASQVVFYCGSGVTAAVNVLAMAHAGLGDARLYVGSWSDWITDPQRPVA